MRLTCPSCAAEYEIDAGAIGRAGRMVRCAACAAEWFQPPAAPGMEAAADALDEAARKAREARETVLPPEPRRAPVEPPRFEPDEDDAVYVDADPPRARPDPVVIEPPRARREAPDPAALAATLRAEPDGPRAGGAFLAGFATVTFLALVLAAVYVKAPEIAEIAPAAKAPLTAYAAMVDEGRVAVAALAERLR